MIQQREITDALIGSVTDAGSNRQGQCGQRRTCRGLAFVL
jgi:hypothetical protein